MTGFVTTGGSAAVNPFDLSQVPSTNVFEGQDPFSTSQALIQGLNRASINQTAADGGRDPFATPEGPQQGQPVDPAFNVPMITAQQANQKYAAPGLKFNNPLPDQVASEMYNAKVDENMRADVAARASSPVTRDVVGFAAGMLDPVNVAASFIPVLGEGNAARLAAAPVLDRIVTRGVQGAVQGAAGQVPLAALQYGLATQSQQDFTAADALKSVLMGAVFGGIAHPVVGAIGDAFRPATPAPANDAFGTGDPLATAFQASSLADQVSADPLLRQQAASAAIAATVEDRPVDVAPLIELGARQREGALALRSMQYDATQPTSMRLNALEDDMTRPGTPPELVDNLAGQHEALTDIQASEADLAQVKDQPVDPVTQARVDAIDEELTKPGPLSSVRQQQLMQERGMLTQGAAPISPEEAALNAARAESQRAGNQAAIDRNNQRIAALQDQIRQSATVKEAFGGPSPIQAEASARADQAVKEHASKSAESQAPEDSEDFAKVIQGMRDRGELTAEHEAMLSQADEDEAHAGAMAKAHESFANCMAGI